MTKTNLAVAAETKSLETLEAEISELCERFFEDWFHIGARLLLIRDGRKFTQAIDDETGEPFGDWTAYANSDRLPRSLSRSQGNRLVEAAQVRPFLSEVPNGNLWTERSVRPFTKIKHPKTGKILPRRIEAVCKLVVREAEKTKKQITGALVSKYVGLEIGKTQKAIAALPTLCDNVKTERNHIAALLRSYQEIALSEWDKVDETLLKRFAKDLRDLAKFLET